MSKEDLHRGKRWLLRFGAGLLAYAGLILLLYLSEKQNPDASIQSIGDACWYSIVTLSTVGYGDLYPTTAFGRVVGICFVLMSLGVLAFIMGAIVNFLTGRMLPRLRLQHLRKKPWFVFSQINGESLALAADLENQFPDHVILFPQGDGVLEERGYTAYTGSLTQALRGKKEKCTLFFLGNEQELYQQAVEALSLGFPVYCDSQYVPEQCPQGLVIFSRYSGLAQEYWRQNPIAKQENTVLLVGDGKYAQEILEWALTVNVLGPEHPVCYHVFGDWADFRRNHPQLGLTLAVDREAPGMDAVFFHRSPWNQDGMLLASADRILLTSDLVEENLDTLSKLRRYFPVRGKLHVRSGMEIPGEQVFGTDGEIYTADLILRGRLTMAARMLHQIYVDGVGGNAPGWEQLNDFTRRSNIAAAEHLRIKIQLLNQEINQITGETCARAYAAYQELTPEERQSCRALEHLRWMRFHSLSNWRYDPDRDNGARKHPMLIPFEDMTPAEQKKDDFSWELLGAVGEYLSEKV